jgi:hypothetical protein
MNPNHEKHPQVSLIFRHDLPSDRSRYRLVDGSGEEISTANEFLDSLSIRALSERTTRTYAYGLLSFWRWINEEKLEISSLRESDLFRYIRFQNKAAKLKERASPRTVNQRLSVARSLYKWITGQAVYQGIPSLIVTTEPLRMLATSTRFTVSSQSCTSKCRIALFRLSRRRR